MRGEIPGRLNRYDVCRFCMHKETSYLQCAGESPEQTKSSTEIFSYYKKLQSTLNRRSVVILAARAQKKTGTHEPGTITIGQRNI